MTPRERFEALWAANYSDVYAFVARRLGDSEAARDATAEAFLVVWRRLEDVPSDARPWIFGVARKVVSNTIRSNRRKHLLITRLAGVEQPLEIHDVPVDLTAVAAAFDRLKPSDRELLSLVTWDDLSPREAAKVLGLPVARFSVRLHRAKQRLRKELAATGQVGDRHHSAPDVAAPAAKPVETR